MTAIVDYQESDAERKSQQAALSHVSVELGHLYAEDFDRGPEYLVQHFRRVKPLLDVVKSLYETPSGKPLRLSTCFLIDDYFTPFGTPAKVFAGLQAAAAESGVQLDYIARESGCVVADEVRLAELVLDKLVAEPTPNTTGVRPSTSDSGWLANGERSGSSDQAMSYVPWTPPRENARNRHSIFVDVELWDDRGKERRWACAYLAAVWQLARLGVLRDDEGYVAVQPYEVEELPERWTELPAVVRVNHNAKPFSAYRTFSILNSRYLPVEHATRVILGQVGVDDSVFMPIWERAAQEQITLAKETVDRIQYAFVS